MTILTLGGVDTANPIDAFVGAASATDPLTVPAITTTADNEGIMVLCSATGGGNGMNVPAGTAAIHDAQKSGGAASGLVLRPFGASQTTAGSTGTKVCDATSAGAVVGHQIALRRSGTAASTFKASDEWLGHSATNPAAALTLIRDPTTAQFDVMLAQIVVRGGTATAITPPAGWTLVMRTDDGTTMSQAVYRKAAGAAEPNDYTFTLSQAIQSTGILLSYQGVDNANPVDASVGSAGTGNPLAVTAVTTTAANEMVALFCSVAVGGGQFQSNGLTSRTNNIQSGGGTSGAASRAYDYVQATAGPTGTKNCDTSNDRTIGQQVALRPVTIGFSPATGSGFEAVTSPTITVTLSSRSTLATTANYALGTGSTATSPADYTFTAGTVTVPAGSLTATVPLTIVNDAVVESSETVVLTLSSPGNANLGAAGFTYTIIDDDTPPSVTLSLSGSPIAEAAGVATLTATLSAATSQTVTVNLAYTGTATLATDYTSTPASITINAGSTTGTRTITAVQDALNEAAETVVVDISSVTNGVESGTQQVIATITDDDAAPTVTLGLSGSPMLEAAGIATVTATLSAASGQTVTVNLAYTGTATLATDYTSTPASITINAGSTTGTRTITAVQDALDEAAETIIVDIVGVTNGVESGTQQVTATITDDDPTPTVLLSLAGSPMAEAAGIATLTATLSAVSGQAVTVNLAYAGTATSVTDYASASSITINAGSLTGTGAITAVQDTIDEADETVIVDISSVVNGLESGTQQVTATITDDDAPPTVTLSLSGSPMAEAAGVATVTATLSAASSLAVTVTLAYTGTATLTSDYTHSGTSIVINAGSTTGTRTITAVQDAVAEPTETVIVDITTVTNGAESGTQQVTASITDDEPIVTVTAAAATVPEAGPATTFTITRTGSTASPLTVTFALSGAAASGTDYVLTGTATSTTAILLPTQATVVLTLTPVDDASGETAEAATLTLSASAAYTVGTPAAATVTINDNDPLVVVALDPVDATGAPVPGAAWGGWAALPGAALTTSANYLKVTSNSFTPTQGFLLDFTPASLTGVTLGTETIAINNNIQFACWEDTTPVSTSPTEAGSSYTFGATSATGSTPCSFTGLANVMYLRYRLVAIPNPVMDQAYSGAFTVTAT
jgi:hypothetical protein